MQYLNSHKKYGLLMKTLHWLMAVLVFVMITLGFYMVSLDLSINKARLVAWHESLGVIILLLVTVRVILAYYQLKPSLPQHATKIVKVLAKISHIVLYLLLFFLPISGILMVSAADLYVPFFHLYSWAPIIPASDYWFDVLKDIHHAFAFLLCAILIAHIVMALVHHFYYKDNTFLKMLPFGKLRHNKT